MKIYEVFKDQYTDMCRPDGFEWVSTKKAFKSKEKAEEWAKANIHSGFCGRGEWKIEELELVEQGTFPCLL